MRRVDRGTSLPKAMDGPESSAAKERAKAKEYVTEARARVAAGEKRGKTYEFSVYKDEGAKRALEQLFHGKCAYCESNYAAQAPVDIEHFRPKGPVEDDPDHFGYWWLAASWTNLLPSCVDCNRRRYQILAAPDIANLAAMQAQAVPLWKAGKESAFPVRPGTRAYGAGPDPDGETEAEQPYLLDPCRDDPAEHLEFLVDAPEPFGLVLPKRLAAGDGTLPLIAAGADIDPAIVPPQISARGAVSIQVYGLNRLGLVQARTRILRHLELLGAMVIEAHSAADELQGSPGDDVRNAARLLADFADRLTGAIRDMGAPDQPYSAMVNQWIEHWKKRLQS